MERITGPSSWLSPEAHLGTLLTSPWYQNLALVLDAVCEGAHAYFRGRGAKSVLLPLTTGSISSPMGRGSDSTPVRVELKGQHVYLADSMQFGLELGVRVFGTPVYYVMSSYRGEAVDDRHLNEFFHIEAELPGTFGDLLPFAEGLIRALAGHLLATCPGAVRAAAGTLTHLERAAGRDGSFPRVRYRDAVASLVGEPGALRELAGSPPALTPAGERALVRRYGDFVWLTHLPAALVPFYQAADPGTPDSLTADLLAGPGEILGSGQRQASGADVRAALADHDVNPAEYGWYVEMKDRAPVPTSGFGLGVERFCQWALRAPDIRDCTLLLREHGRVRYP